MSKKTVPDLKELFKQASEIAQQVPANMQEAAFNRALDLLTDADRTNPASGNPPAKKSAAKGEVKAAGANLASNSPLQQLLVAIDSTQHPGVTSDVKVLDRSLMVLQIALTDHKVDGLTPSEIAKILTDKFRVSTTTAAVNMAVGKQAKLVNRIPEGQGFRYRIMGPGQEYLSHLGGTEEPQSSTPRRRRTACKRTTKKTTVSSTSDESEKDGGETNNKALKSRQTSSGGKIGPKAALLELMASGFFSKARTGPETQSYLKKKRGLTLGTDQLRLAMLRLVRDQKLDRDENAEGQYEYKQPGS